METISKAALVAFAFGTLAIASQADAQTLVRFPTKGGVPITVSQAAPKGGVTNTVARETPKIAATPRHERYVVSTIGGHTAARVAKN